MSTDTSAQRAAFEAWFAESRKSKGPSRRPTFERFEDGTYADDSTQRHWWTWQHAASPQPTAAPVAELVEALRALLDEQDAQQGYATPAAYGRARAALSRAPGAGMLNAKLNGAP